MAGLRLTTKVQVSGRRFLLRRLEHALVRRDTRMFDDPIAFYSRSAAAGIVVAVLILLGGLAMAFFKPSGQLGDGDFFIDGSTKQLFVKIAEKVHPVYNLTSARLVLGKPADPATARSAALQKLPQGLPIGIPGAPYATPVAPEAAPVWALCDTVTHAGHPDASVRAAAISMPLELHNDEPVAPQQALLTTYGGDIWAITSNGRHLVDLADRSLTLGMKLPLDEAPSPLSQEMFNAIPDAGPWQLPAVPGAGTPNTVGLPIELVVGSVFHVGTPFGDQFFVVMPDGVAQVNANTAAILRARESYGLAEIPSIVKSQVTSIPERRFSTPFPDQQIQVISRRDRPVLCWEWQRVAGEQAPKTLMLTAAHLPLPKSALDKGIAQLQGALTVYLDGGKFVQIQSPDPRYGESLYYVDPRGARYGIPDAQTASALGLSSPSAAPWEIVRLLVEGPVLSKEAALLERDTLPADPNPREVGVAAGGPG